MSSLTCEMIPRSQLVATPSARASSRNTGTRLDAFYADHEVAELSGLQVKKQPLHNDGNEAWRDGRREARGLQVY